MADSANQSIEETHKFCGSDADARFCFYCGQALIARVIQNAHDTRSGQPLFERVCQNHKCFRHCQSHGGHEFRSQGWLRPRICAKCDATDEGW